MTRKKSQDAAEQEKPAVATFGKAPTLKRINESIANQKAGTYSNTTYEASGGGTYGEWSN